jgi:hypothetical protein
MRVRTDIKAGKGLGDAVADLTASTGLDQLAVFYEQATGKDCGCAARQAKLNAIAPNILPG